MRAVSLREGVLLEQVFCFAQQLVEEILAVVNESADDLSSGNIFVGYLVDVTVVERENLRSGIAKQEGRMARNDELGVFVFLQDVVNQHKECELALR